jgi:hypothetical protein
VAKCGHEWLTAAAEMCITDVLTILDTEAEIAAWRQTGEWPPTLSDITCEWALRRFNEKRRAA